MSTPGAAFGLGMKRQMAHQPTMNPAADQTAALRPPANQMSAATPHAMPMRPMTLQVFAIAGCMKSKESTRLSVSGCAVGAWL